MTFLTGNLSNIVQENSVAFGSLWLLDELPQPAWLAGAGGQILLFNKAWRQLSGRSPEEETASGWPHAVHPLDGDRYYAEFQQAFAARRPIRIEYRYLRSDGACRQLIDDGKPLFQADGTFAGYLVCCTDVTGYQEAGAARLASEENEKRLRSILESSPDVVYRRNLQKDCYEYLSPASGQILGYSVEEMQPMPLEAIFECIHPEDRPHISKELERASRQGKGRFIYRFKTKSGAYRWFADYATIHKDSEGNFSYLDGIMRDITELKEAEMALQQSEQRYRTLFEESPVALWEDDLSEVKVFLDGLIEAGVTDFSSHFEQHPEHLHVCIEKFRLLAANKATIQLYQAEDEEDLYRIFKNRFHSVGLESVRPMLMAIVENQKQYKQEIFERMPNGNEYHIHLAASSGIEPNFSRVLVTGLDISEHKQLEAKIRQGAEYAQSVARVVEQINANLDLNTTLNTICEEVARAFHLPIAGVLLLDEGRDVLQVKAVCGIPADLPKRRIEIAKSDYEQLEQRLGPVYVIPDAREIADLQNLAQAVALDLRTLAATRIVYDGKLIGIIVVSSTNEPRGFSPEEKDLLSTFANQASVAIQKGRLFEELDNRAKRLETLAQVTTLLRQTETVYDMIPLIVDKTRAIFAVNHVALLIQRGQYFEVVAGEGMKRSKIGDQFEADHFTNNVLKGEPLFLSSPEEITELLSKYQFPTLRKLLSAIPACTLVPLETNQTTIGLLYLGYQGPHAFTDEEKRLLAALSEIIGNSIQRMEIVNILERRVADRTRELDTLYRVASVASTKLSLNEIMQQSLDIILPSVAATCGMIHLLAGDDDFAALPGDAVTDPAGLHLAAASGLPEELLSRIRTIPIGYGLAGQVAQRDEALVIADYARDPRAGFRDFFTGKPINFFGIPIHRSEQVIGVMSIYGPQKKMVASEDIALLTTVGDQLGVVIENAMLQRQAELGLLTAERQRLARELHDSITQVLYALNLFASAGLNLALSGDRRKILSYFEKISANAQQALKEMRLLIYELRPSALEKGGLIAALRQRLEAVETKAGISASLMAGENLCIPKKVETDLYRIAQEALNNALKHAQASAVSVQFKRQGDLLAMEIADNGIGFDAEKIRGRGGFGLQSMQERAKKIGGKLSITSSPQNGTLVKVEAKW